MQLLAESKNYLVEHEYETVLPSPRSGGKVVIGEFYGDPDVAIIDQEEKWCAIGGCGLIVYWLEQPFAEYHYRTHSPQYFEMNRYPPDVWWVEEIDQVGANQIKIRLADQSTYQISFEKREASPNSAVKVLKIG